MLVCACAWARGRGRVRTVCEKRGKKKGNLLCLPSTFFAPVPLFTLPVFSSTLPCLLAVRCPSNRLRQQAVAAAAAAYTRVLYIRPSYSAFFFPPSSLPFSIHRSWHSQISCGESSSHLKCMKERQKRTSGVSPPKTTSLHCSFFFFPNFFFFLPIPNLCLQPSTLVDSHFYLHPRCLRRPSRELLRSNSKVVLYELEAMVKEWIKEVILSKVRDHDNYDTSKAHSKENGHDTSRHRAAGAALHAPALVSAPGSHWHSFFAQILKYKRSQTQNNHIMIFNRSPFLPCGALALSLSLPLSRSLALSLPPSPSSFIAFPTAYLSGRKDRAFLSIATTKPPRLWHMIVPSRVFSFFF